MDNGPGLGSNDFEKQKDKPQRYIKKSVSEALGLEKAKKCVKMTLAAAVIGFWTGAAAFSWMVFKSERETTEKEACGERNDILGRN